MSFEQDQRIAMASEDDLVLDEEIPYDRPTRGRLPGILIGLVIAALLSGVSSSADGKRPRWGNTPITSKALAVIEATSTWSGGPARVSGNWRLPSDQSAPNASYERLLFAKCQ